MTNPLLAAWETPFGVPPFEGLEPDHFRPAFDHAMSQQRREVEAVMSDSAPAGFANTIEALELSGRSLRQVAAVFFSLAGAHTSEALQEIEREIAPVLARHRTWIYQNEALFGRINRLWDRRDMLGLTPEQSRVLERYRTSSSVMVLRSTPTAAADSARSPSAWRPWAPASARTCWPTRPRSGWCSKARATLPAFPISSARPRHAPPPTTICPAAT
jgi:hypothetical protein